MNIGELMCAVSRNAPSNAITSKIITDVILNNYNKNIKNVVVAALFINPNTI